MGRIDDARKECEIAEKLLRDIDYAGAIHRTQMCAELTAKALLEHLKIDYSIKKSDRKKYLHDVSDKIPEVFEKLKPNLETYEVETMRETLARLIILLKLLTSIKDYAQHGIPELQIGGRNIFDLYFSQNLVKSLFKKTKKIHLDISYFLSKKF